MLLRRKMEESTARFCVRDNTLRLLIVVLTTSSATACFNTVQDQVANSLTDIMLQDDMLITFPEFGGFSHLDTLAHFPVPIT